VTWLCRQRLATPARNTPSTAHRVRSSLEGMRWVYTRSVNAGCRSINDRPVPGVLHVSHRQATSLKTHARTVPSRAEAVARTFWQAAQCPYGATNRASVPGHGLLPEADDVRRFSQVRARLVQVGSGEPVSGSLNAVRGYPRPAAALRGRRADHGLTTTPGDKWTSCRDSPQLATGDPQPVTTLRTKLASV
jgi:hypothetical protein